MSRSSGWMAATSVARRSVLQEVLLHATIYCGVPAAVEAFRTANEVVTPNIQS